MNNNYTYTNYRQIIPDPMGGSISNQNMRGTTNSNSIEWKNKIFTGTISEVGSDYILLNDDKSNKNVLIWIYSVDFIIFNN